jgi:hypothetical protein
MPPVALEFGWTGESLLEETHTDMDMEYMNPLKQILLRA